MLVDISTLIKLSGNDSKYIYEIINIFTDSTSSSLAKLQLLSKDDNNHLEVASVAHSIKSGVSIIQINGMLDELIMIEQLAAKKENMHKVRDHIEKATYIFKMAMPILLEQIEKNKPS